MEDEDAVGVVRAWRAIKRSSLLVVCRPRPEFGHNGSGDAQSGGKSWLLPTVQRSGLSQTLLTVGMAVEYVIGASLAVTDTHTHECQ